MIKSPPPPHNAILLCDGKWIDMVIPQGDFETAAEIDPLMEGLWPMWVSFETECVARCCGIRAYDFTENNVANAITTFDCADICRLLKKLRANLDAISNDMLVSAELNTCFDRSVFVALIDYLQEQFCGSAQ